MKLNADLARKVLAQAESVGPSVNLPEPADDESALRSFCLPLPPSTNNLFATVVVAGKYRRVKTQRYKQWLLECAFGILSRVQVRSPVSVSVELVGKVNAARDGDNFLKPTLDALVEYGVIAGDSLKHVRRVSLSLGADRTGEPFMAVAVEHLPGEAP